MSRFKERNGRGRIWKNTNARRDKNKQIADGRFAAAATAPPAQPPPSPEARKQELAAIEEHLARKRASREQGRWWLR